MLCQSLLMVPLPMKYNDVLHAIPKLAYNYHTLAHRSVMSIVYVMYIAIVSLMHYIAPETTRATGQGFESWSMQALYQASILWMNNGTINSNVYTVGMGNCASYIDIGLHWLHDFKSNHRIISDHRRLRENFKHYLSKRWLFRHSDIEALKYLSYFTLPFYVNCVFYSSQKSLQYKTNVT